MNKSLVEKKIDDIQIIKKALNNTVKTFRAREKMIKIRTDSGLGQSPLFLITERVLFLLLLLVLGVVPCVSVPRGN